MPITLFSKWQTWAGLVHIQIPVKRRMMAYEEWGQMDIDLS